MFLTPIPDRRSFVVHIVHTYPHDKMLTAAWGHIVKLIIKLFIKTAIVAPDDADNPHTQRKKQCLFHRSTPYKLNEMICSEFAVPNLGASQSAIPIDAQTRCTFRITPTRLLFWLICANLIGESAITALTLHIALTSLPILQILLATFVFVAKTTFALQIYTTKLTVMLILRTAGAIVTQTTLAISIRITTVAYGLDNAYAHVIFANSTVTTMTRYTEFTFIIAPDEASHSHTQRKKQCLSHRPTPYKLNKLICSELASPNVLSPSTKLIDTQTRCTFRIFSTRLPYRLFYAYFSIGVAITTFALHMLRTPLTKP